MRNLKILIGITYTFIIICMGAATVIEKLHGTQFAYNNIYGAWWFTALWAVMTAAAAAYFIRRRIHRASVATLHLAFVIILTGALLTHLTSIRGIIHLRQGQPTDTYLIQMDDNIIERQLPFRIRLDNFEVAYHNGTTSAADYVSHFTITDNGQHQGTVSMNNIYTRRGIRLYQSDYDPDMQGSILSLNADPWGIPVTYLGYALLFIALILMLLEPSGTFRRMLRSEMMRNSTLILLLAIGSAVCSPASARAAVHTDEALPVLPRETADAFGRMHIMYNGRICPVQTFAIDFTRKLYGQASYKDYTAEQVLTGFMFWGSRWYTEPIVRMKKGPLRETLMLPEFCSVNTFFNRDMGGYILGPYVSEHYSGNNDKFHRDVADTDDRLMMVMEVCRGTLLKIFPYTDGDRTAWFSPTDKPTAAIPSDHALYMANALTLLEEAATDGNFRRADALISKMQAYQQQNSGSSMPAPFQTKAERIYNAVPFATILFMVNLTVGMVMLLMEIRRITTIHDRKSGSTNSTTLSRGVKSYRLLHSTCIAVMCMSVAALTVCEALRWIISGTIPMANGYETMLFVAWCVMIAALVAAHRFRIALTFGFIMSGLFLLVAHIGQMNPNISHVMPVLNSPLLSIHVSVIMISFALLAMTFICGVTALIIGTATRKRAGNTTLEALQLLSRLFLYPALTTLGIGIFVGAIWANVSWGQYWGWDPKEVWALITLMIYAVAVHTRSIPALSRPMPYHIFMTLAFLTVLMTYFGVNYVLGGMHSYA